MKFTLTPLLLFSIGLFFYGLYLWIFVYPDEGSWGTLAAIVTTGTGIVAFLFYLILRAIFKNRIWTQIAFELLIICAVIVITINMDE